MKVSDALQRIRTITVPQDSPRVAHRAAKELKARSGGDVVIGPPRDGGFEIVCGKGDRAEVSFRLDEDGSGLIESAAPRGLYGFVLYLLDRLGDRDVEAYREGVTFSPAFQWQRTSYDYFLTQEGRIQRNLDRETYVRGLARAGFTHIEVNGLAYPMGLETGPRGETYPMFYTYCPALDQFVDSRLNKGLYPRYYLSANLDYLKENARLASEYGLTPGLLCFEPRSVPEEFFARYPMLRGARVDHPLRSFKPRYNMTIVHPKVREHYREMLQKLMEEVPELGFLCIWTNDSGAGFEHTKSLYVGRNGGAYLIREWKDDEEIARQAGENALRFFRCLRDAGREVNPDFRVITRMESFYGEHDTVWKGLGEGVEVETASLLARGWEMPYTHPRYSDSNAVTGGSVHQNRFDEKEKPLMEELKDKGALAHFYFTAGPHILFEPLLGVPYPRLTFERLKAVHEGGVECLAHSGGGVPPKLVPYNVNFEILRAFSFDPEMDIDAEIMEIARKWVREVFYEDLVEAWRGAEEAILAFPNFVPMYSGFGFTWYRLWVRPLVPDIEGLAWEERAYYEEFMCTTPHNTNNVDLSRDVLFRLLTPEACARDLGRMDENLWPPLEAALQRLRLALGKAEGDEGAHAVLFDQLTRLRALKCWFRTQHGVAAWVRDVYGYLDTDGDAKRKAHRASLREMMEREIENTKELIELLASGVEFMAITDRGETPLVHGDNLEELLGKRIEIMERHMDDEPFIDHGYMERKAAGLLND